MVVKTTRFGEIEVDEAQVIVFPEGIPGFSGRQRFIVLKLGLEETPFWWLQNTDTGELCFLAVEPGRVIPEYDFKIPDEQLDLLQLNEGSGLEALAIVTVRDGNLSKATANLKAPVLINPDARVGVQLILDNAPYDIRQPLFAAAGV